MHDFVCKIINMIEKKYGRLQINMITQKQSDKNGSRVHYGWICATGGLNSLFVLATATSTLPLVLVNIEREVGISNAQAGAISATYGFLFIIGAFSWGILADKIGLRKTLTLACLMLAIGTLGMGTMNSIIIGMVFYSIIGFAAGAPTTLGVILAGAWFSSRRRGIAQSYINSPRTLWNAMLGIAVPLIMIAFGWRNVWYILGVLSLFLTVTVYALVRNSPKEKGLLPCGEPVKDSADTTKARSQKAPKEQASSRDVIKMGITWHLGTVYILNVFIFKTVSFFIVAYLITEVKLTPLAAGGAFSIFAVAMMFGSYVWGFMSDYVPRKYVLTTTSILYAVSLLVFTGLGKEIAVIYVIVGAMGFAIGTSAVTFAMIPDYFPSKVTGTASGLVNAISGVGFILGPLIAGSIATTTGSFVPAFQIAALLAIVLAAVSLALRKPTNP